MPARKPPVKPKSKPFRSQFMDFERGRGGFADAGNSPMPAKDPRYKKEKRLNPIGE